MSAFVNAQITPLDQWKTKGNTFTTNTNYLGTNNSRSLILKTNSTQVGKIDSVGKWTIGTGTVAANTSSLGIVRIKQGSSWTDIGEYFTGGAALWMNTTNSTTNPFLYSNSTGSSKYINAPTTLNFGTSGVDRLSLNSTLLSSSTNFSLAGTSTLTGAVTTSTINNGAGSLYLGTYGNNNYIIGGGFMNFAPSGNSTTGSATQFNFVTASHYSLTASTNVPAFKVTGATRGFLSGAKALQYESYLTAPTYTANGATTITTASGLHVEKPIAGSNITITNNYGISTDGNLLLGSAGLTGGNTGTVAVLSDAVFSMNFMSVSSNPADATTYFFANMPYGIQTVSYGAIYAPYNCTFIGWTFNAVPSVVATTESATLQIAVNSATTNLNTGIQLNGVTNTYTASGLSQSIAAGDKIEPKLICPTYATNPTGVGFGITLWFVRRQ